ncbi:MAG: hypothetical protein R3A47_11690 [Polyangiales bacterium]
MRWLDNVEFLLPANKSGKRASSFRGEASFEKETRQRARERMDVEGRRENRTAKSRDSGDYGVLVDLGEGLDGSCTKVKSAGIAVRASKIWFRLVMR